MPRSAEYEAAGALLGIASPGVGRAAAAPEAGLLDLFGRAPLAAALVDERSAST